MAKKSGNDSKIERELADLKRTLENLPANPIPWAQVIAILAPMVARLAVRYALKRTARGLSEDKVTAIGDRVGNFISGIVTKRMLRDEDLKGL